MRVIALSTPKKFWDDAPARMDAREPTLAWYRHVLKADWASPAGVKWDFANASILKGGRVVFKGIVVDAELIPATGSAEWDAALSMVERHPATKRITLGADKHYDTKPIVTALRKMTVTPHMTQHTTNRKSAIDGRTTSHSDYRINQKVRNRVEEIFGRMKTVGVFRKMRYIGTEKVGWHFTLTAAAYSLVRTRNLLGTA